jgi:branched-chain amino acid transport system permease protein
VAKVGVDEWVEQSADRREAYSGLSAPLRTALDRIPPAAKLGTFALLAALVPLLVSSDYVVRVGVNTLLLALLALGLNVVVGWAGLLDLGYIAFYGFGAYAYALLSSEQIGVHLPTIPAVLIVIVACALLGLLLGLPSRRLLGDYLAIVTLFFGQVFVELVLNLDRVRLPGADEPIALTGGTNGIPGVDPMVLFGFELEQNEHYYWLALGTTVLVAVVLHRMNESRTGRAWRAVREDPLAAEFMTIPVNRVKLVAFAVGAAIAGLAGSVFAAVQIGVFPANFETSFLILIYAAVILGGAGSLAGAVLGAVVVSVALELLRDPTQASVVFYGLLLVTLVARLRPPWRLGAVLGGLVALGLVLGAVLGDHGSVRAEGWLADVLNAVLVLPEDPSRALGNWLFLALIAGGLAWSRAPEPARTVLLVPLLHLAALAWELRLVAEPAITRQLLLGLLLVVLMNARPQGLLGRARVEVP